MASDTGLKPKATLLPSCSRGMEGGGWGRRSNRRSGVGIGGGEDCGMVAGGRVRGRRGGEGVGIHFGFLCWVEIERVL